MHRIDTEGHADGLFQDGTPQVGQQGTILGSDWLNDMQENIAGVIEGVGEDLEKGNFEQLKLAIAAMIANAAVDWTETIDSARVRPGIIEMFGGAAAPVGYLECDGAAVLRAAYPALFDAIGVTYGAGDGATTFNLPDLRGEFVRGWDHGRGVDPDRALGTAQGDMLKAHTHSLPSNSDQGTGTASVEDGDGTGTPRAINSGSTGGAETRPRNVALMYVIKT